MRPTVLALALAAASLGCSSLGSRPKAQATPHKTPVVLEKPSLSRRIMDNRLEQGQKVTGKTEVEGALVRK